jgi:hypothetical protein
MTKVGARQVRLDENEHKARQGKTWLGGSKMVFENPYITLYGTIAMWQQTMLSNVHSFKVMI